MHIGIYKWMARHRLTAMSDKLCDRHDVESAPGDECPYCARERHREQMEREQMERRADPQMSNHVDAQANAIDHSRPRGP